MFMKQSAYIRSDEGLTLETSAFRVNHGGNSTFIISFDKTKFLLSLSQRRSTTVSLETINPLHTKFPRNSFSSEY